MASNFLVPIGPGRGATSAQKVITVLKCIIGQTYDLIRFSVALFHLFKHVKKGMTASKLVPLNVPVLCVFIIYLPQSALAFSTLLCVITVHIFSCTPGFL